MGGYELPIHRLWELPDITSAPMKAIRLESFRCLADTGFVTLRPLTLLVGKNSSGKSSFLRFLPLLRQSVHAPTTGPVQWYGDYVDFGGFSETLASFSKKKQIRFHFKLTLHPDSIQAHMRRPGYFIRPQEGEADDLIDCKLALTIVPDPRDNSITRFDSISIRAAGQEIDVTISGLNRVSKIVVNGRQPLKDSSPDLRTAPGALLPSIHRKIRSSRGDDSHLRYSASPPGRPLAIAQLVQILRPMFHGNTAMETIAQVGNRVPFGTDESIFKSLRALKHLGKSWASSVRALRVPSDRFTEIRDLLIANSLPAIIQHLDSQLWFFASGIRYVKPVRATAQRYYRPQDLAVGEVDPEGKNLAMFLRSLTDSERTDFDEWMAEELGWTIASGLRGGHVSLSIHERGDRSYNLTDVGFGFSQLLPVIAQLWSMQHPRFRQHAPYAPQLTFAIEQPELHLHPGLQARLADILIRSIVSAERHGIGLTMIVETHSEAIINRIGQRIADGDLGPDKAAVVLFDAVDASGVSKVNTGTFGSDGFLRNWPYGFFEPE